MFYPAVKPNKHFILQIAKGTSEASTANSNKLTSSYQSQTISITPNITNNNAFAVNASTKKTNDNLIDTQHNEIHFNTLETNLQKNPTPQQISHKPSNSVNTNIHNKDKDKREYLTNTNSRHKINLNSYLTSGDLKTVSVNSDNLDEIGLNNGKSKKPLHGGYKRGTVDSNKDTITVDSGEQQDRFLQHTPDEYNQYVVVSKQLKYGNKNIDLARKSQIADPREILYNQ